MPTSRNNHPQTWEELLTLTLQAVQEAIIDARSQKTLYRARHGRKEQADSGSFRYQFQTEGDWEPVANARVRIVLNAAEPADSIAGVILSSLDTPFFVVSTEVPLPEAHLEKVRIAYDTAWLLERLQEALVRVQSRGTQSMILVAKVFGLLSTTGRFGKPQAHIATFQPDADQARAIALVMESEVGYVLGAGGTGKTATEDASGLELLLAGKTVLLVAPTNQAVDTAMQRLQQYCEQSGNAALIQKHLLVRAGTPVDLPYAQYRHITLQGIVDLQLGELALQRDRLLQEQSNVQEAIKHEEVVLAEHQRRWKSERASLLQRSDAVARERAQIEQREQQRLTGLAARFKVLELEQVDALRRQRAAERDVQQTTALLLEMRTERKRIEQELQASSAALVTFRARSWGGRLLSSIGGSTEQSLVNAQERWLETLKQMVLQEGEQEQKRDRAEHMFALFTSQVERIQEEAQRIQEARQLRTAEARRIEELSVILDAIASQIEQGDHRLNAYWEQLEQLRQTAARNTTTLDAIAVKQRDCTQDVLKNARLIGTTLAGLTTNYALRDRMFDVVIVDETSMASLPSVLVASSHATRQVAFFGDNAQLTPIIQLTNKTRTPTAAYWLGTDIFSHLGLSPKDAYAGDRPVVFLSEQSRMHPLIAAPLSQLIYGGRLKTRVNPHHVPLLLAPHPESPLMVIDTSDVDRDKGCQESKICRTERPSSRRSSRCNLYHVQCVLRLVKLLLDQLPASEKPQIGIVTPYRLQKDRICQALQQAGLLHLVRIGTAHSFQSAEYRCIIFDTTEGYGMPISQFLSNRLESDGVLTGATRLLNVAHSRAQDKLIYIANMDVIQKDAFRRNHLLTRLIAHAATQGYMGSAALTQGR